MPTVKADCSLWIREDSLPSGSNTSAYTKANNRSNWDSGKPIPLTCHTHPPKELNRLLSLLSPKSLQRGMKRQSWNSFAHSHLIITTSTVHVPGALTNSPTSFRRHNAHSSRLHSSYASYSNEIETLNIQIWYRPRLETVCWILGKDSNETEEVISKTRDSICLISLE